MCSLKIDTIKLRVPSEYYKKLKQYLLGNGYKLRQDDNNKYITKAYLPGLRITVLKIYQSDNRFGSGCYIEFYGLGEYDKQIKNEKEMALQLVMYYLSTNGVLGETKVTKLDIAVDIKAKPSQVYIRRKKGLGRAVISNKNTYSENWFKTNSFYIEGSNLKQLRYKNEKNDEVLVNPIDLINIVGTSIKDINISFREACKTGSITVQKFKKQFKEKNNYWFDGDYFVIKEDLLGCYAFDVTKFSLVKKQNATTAILYNKAHKNGLKYDLSRFEVRFVSKDIKGHLSSQNGLSELLKGIYKVLNRYSIQLGNHKLYFSTGKIGNWGLLNSYNN